MDKIIIFDIDGTLLDMDERWWQLHVDMTRANGLPCLQRDAYIAGKKAGRTEREMMVEVSDNYDAVESYIKARVDHIEDKPYLSVEKIYDGVKELLAAAREKYEHIHFVTMRRRKEDLLWQMNVCGLDVYADEIVSAWPEKKHDYIAHRYNKAERAHMTFVGDSLLEHRDMTEMGVRSILVGYGTRTSDYFAKKGIHENIIHAPRDLIQCI